MLLDNVSFGENVRETATHIHSTYQYDSTEVVKLGDGPSAKYSVQPKSDVYEFVTDKRVPKLGVMLVGWGGNNGTTVTAGVLANRHGVEWRAKSGVRKPNYYGSLTQAYGLESDFSDHFSQTLVCVVCPRQFFRQTALYIVAEISDVSLSVCCA